jgi:site-specific DNA recombinase
VKAVIYLRVSTKEQAEEGYSIPAQAEACRRFIADQGWELADAYVDRGESARTAERPQLQTMLARLAEDRSIDSLVVHKLDRLARNLEDHAAVRAAFREAGVQLHSVTESLEDSASGKIVEGILASIAEFYSANLGQEIRRGMDQKAAQGGWPVRAPFGYRNARRDGPGRRGESVLEPDPQAPLVVWAFERYSTGSLSLDGLTDALGEKGLRNRLGNPPGKSAVHRMLRNPVYGGIVRWKGVERAGIHIPLVSRELFDRVQSVLDSHSSGGERSWKHDHYLKGTLVCAECGSRLYYVVAKGRFGYFRCIGRNTGRARCSQGGYVPAAELEQEVEALYQGVRVPAALRHQLERVLRVEVAERGRHRAEAAEFLARRLRQLANEREKLLCAYYADAIDVATLKREQSRINAEVAEAESRLATDGEKLEQAKQIIDLALDLAKDCATSYHKARPDVRKMWNRAFFQTIRVRDGAIADFTYEEPFGSLLGSHKGSMVDMKGLDHGPRRACACGDRSDRICIVEAQPRSWAARPTRPAAQARRVVVRPSLVRMEAVAWSAGRKASSRNSATVTSTAVPKWVRVVSSCSSPSLEASRRGTAKPR